MAIGSPQNLADLDAPPSENYGAAISNPNRDGKHRQNEHLFGDRQLQNRRGAFQALVVIVSDQHHDADRAVVVAAAHAAIDDERLRLAVVEVVFARQDWRLADAALSFALLLQTRRN